MSNSLKERLKRRAVDLAKARAFFTHRGIIEVDCIALGQSACIDVHIDLFEVSSPIHGRRYLFSSPEYPMKRLLAEGSGDIYYLGHVWRHEEAGRRHSPEFLMAEWYRLDLTFEQMMAETIDFVQLFVPQRKTVYLCYREAFRRYASIDPFLCSDQELQKACSHYTGYPIETASRDELLNLLLGAQIEPCFPKNEITILYHYPASQAALSCHTVEDGQVVAERFELYCEGLELANGYHELTDSFEQRDRFIHDNATRACMGKAIYPVDEKLVAALAKGLPSCCGVAVGMDRLIMIEEGSDSIDRVLPIGWTEA